jgi:hypothetical protein
MRQLLGNRSHYSEIQLQKKGSFDNNTEKFGSGSEKIHYYFKSFGHRINVCFGF